MENIVIEMGDDLSGKDHLHIRGEYDPSIEQRLRISGSPPHTWRIRDKITPKDVQYGITSTYVENTYNVDGNIAVVEDHLHIRGEYN